MNEDRSRHGSCTRTKYHNDHLSVRMITNTDGSIGGQRGHYPFGEVWYSQGTSTNRAFTNYIRDSESANDYAVVRQFSNRTGRFLQADLIDGTPENPQSWNRYAYVMNNPLTATDPLGLWCSAAVGDHDTPCNPYNFGEGGYGGGGYNASNLFWWTIDTSMTFPYVAFGGPEGQITDIGVVTLVSEIWSIGLTPNLVGGTTATPSSDPRHAGGVCSGTAAFKMRYDITNDYVTGRDTAENHIKENHIDFRPGKSRYITDPITNRSNVFEQVKVFNLLTLFFGRQVGSRNTANYAFEWNPVPPVPNPYIKRPNIQVFLGISNGVLVATNRLVVTKNDCQPWTSYPVRP